MVPAYGVRALLGGRAQDSIESGEGGPCLTDAAHAAALDEPLAFGSCRYAAIRTDTEAIIAALNPGGVMESSGFYLFPHTASSRGRLD
jgi:hypothetical protein